jgi:hypothetical protein
MNMKVHQTLVWLNLLSFRTKGLAEPTIGIQSGLCHGWRLAFTNNTAGHCVFITPVSLMSSCILSCQLFRTCTPPPPQSHSDLTLAFLYWHALLSLPYRPGRQRTDPTGLLTNTTRARHPPTPGRGGGVAGESEFAS